MRANVLFVIGMHRSGTSLIGNCLTNNGFSIGKTKNTDVNWQNPNGYFENDRFTNIHERILAYNRCSWHSIKRLKMKYNDAFVDEYIQLLRSEFGQHLHILIKDPRLTFMVDFLVDVCGRMNYTYRFVFCTRNKDECCQSLCNAQKISHDAASALYDATHSCYSEQYLKIDHTDLIFDNNCTIQRILDYCGCDCTCNTNHIVDMKLYRNRS